MRRTEDTFTATIYIAGDVAIARDICRKFCMSEGFCVTVTETSFIYTGGEEVGVAIGIINYPRFPASSEKLMDTAFRLAEKLRDGLCQHSYSIVSPDITVWDSRREA